MSQLVHIQFFTFSDTLPFYVSVCYSVYKFITISEHDISSHNQALTMSNEIERERMGNSLPVSSYRWPCSEWKFRWFYFFKKSYSSEHWCAIRRHSASLKLLKLKDLEAREIQFTIHTRASRYIHLTSI